MTSSENSGASTFSDNGLMRLLLAPGVIILVGIVFWKIKILLQPPDEVQILTVDMYQMFLPWYSITASSLRNLSFPLWFPYAGAGFPWFATPSTAVLYPPNLLYLICSPPLAMGILGQFHLILASIGVYGFCRMHSLERTSSLLAGTAYMLSENIWINFFAPHYLAGVAWLPIVFLCGEMLYRRPSIRSALLLTIVISMQFLSGSAQFFLYTIYFTVFYLGLRLFVAHNGQIPPGTKLRVPILVALSILLVVLICAVQLLPSFEFLGQSVRSENLSEDYVHFMGIYFPWWCPFLGVFDATLPITFSSQPYVYRGALLQSFLILYSLFMYKDRRVHVLVIIAMTSLLLSSGYATPFYRLFALLPGIGRSRQPDHVAVVAAFALAGLAGLGLQAFLDNFRDAEKRKKLFEMIRLAGAGCLLAVILWRFPSNGKIIFPVIGFIILAVGILADGSSHRRVTALFICALLAIELGIRRDISSSHPQAYPDYVRKDSLKILDRLPDIIGDNRIFIEERGIPPRPFPAYRVAEKGVSTVADYHPSILLRMADIIEAIEGMSRPYVPVGLIRLTAKTARPELLNMLSVKYLLVHVNDNVFDNAKTDSPMWKFAGGLQHIITYKGYSLLLNKNAMPRAYIVHGATIAKDRFESRRATLADSFNPRRSVVLEGETARDILPMLSGSESKDRVKVISRSANTVHLKVASDQGGILVLTDSYYPGWIAEVDGNPATIYRANYLFRAVYVPAGEHMVKFTYHPKSFYAGLCLSGLGLLALCTGFIWTRQKNLPSNKS